MGTIEEMPEEASATITQEQVDPHQVGETPESNQSDDEFDFDDEDLETSNEPAPEVSGIVKHPEIIEEFDNLENHNLIMYIFARYSHLPYHYILDGVRHKFLLSGSQIISSTV